MLTSFIHSRALQIAQPATPVTDIFRRHCQMALGHLCECEKIVGTGFGWKLYEIIRQK